MPVREYPAHASSTATFGRVHAHARSHHLIVDGPQWNGCRGEAITPGEMFLAAVASCAVELIDVIAADRGVTHRGARVAATAYLDTERPLHPDRAVFNSVKIECEIEGVSPADAELLVEAFTRRCPLFGTLSVACPDVQVTTRAMP